MLDSRAYRKIPLALQNSFGDLSALALNVVNIDLFKGLQLPDFRVLLPEFDGPPQSGPIHQSGSRFLNISKSINCAHIQRLLIILHSSFIVINLAKLLLNDVELSYQVLDVKVFLASLPRVKVQKLVV